MSTRWSEVSVVAFASEAHRVPALGEEQRQAEGPRGVCGRTHTRGVVKIPRKQPVARGATKKIAKCYAQESSTKHAASRQQERVERGPHVLVARRHVAVLKGADAAQPRLSRRGVLWAERARVVVPVLHRDAALDRVEVVRPLVGVPLRAGGRGGEAAAPTSAPPDV